ncbi:hypothetical protein HBI39_131250 [Parastagonospora nodorum]|nr:hypothetical protein HBI39_131250 [Parastagonospora nodorum]
MKVKHSDLLTSYTGFQIADTFYIIFERPECDLRGFMSGGRDKHSCMTAKWLMQQLIGLADALRAVHDSQLNKHGIGPHGVKPTSILVTKDNSGHVLKLTNWSCAKADCIVAGATHKTLQGTTLHTIRQSIMQSQVEDSANFHGLTISGHLLICIWSCLSGFLERPRGSEVVDMIQVYGSYSAFIADVEEEEEVQEAPDAARDQLEQPASNEGF